MDISFLILNGGYDFTYKDTSKTMNKKTCVGVCCVISVD